MRPIDVEYKFKRAEHNLEHTEEIIDALADSIESGRLRALRLNLKHAHTHLSMAHTRWERSQMSHRQMASEFDI